MYILPSTTPHSTLHQSSISMDGPISVLCISVGSIEVPSIYVYIVVRVLAPRAATAPCENQNSRAVDCRVLDRSNVDSLSFEAKQGGRCAVSRSFAEASERGPKRRAEARTWVLQYPTAGPRAARRGGAAELKCSINQPRSAMRDAPHPHTSHLVVLHLHPTHA